MQAPKEYTHVVLICVDSQDSGTLTTATVFGEVSRVDGEAHKCHSGVCVARARSGEVVELATPRDLRTAVEDLGLQRALGFLRMLRLSPDDPLNYPDEDEAARVPQPPHPDDTPSDALEHLR